MVSSMSSLSNGLIGIAFPDAKLMVKSWFRILAWHYPRMLVDSNYSTHQNSFLVQPLLVCVFLQFFVVVSLNLFFLAIFFKVSYHNVKRYLLDHDILLQFLGQVHLQSL
jgi:hypothetical protein